jgi:hypothetical protein
MDDDLDAMSREDPVSEIKQYRSAVRAYRDSTGHNLCWHHPDLWSLLPEKLTPAVQVPDWPQFMRGCIRHRESLDEQAPNALRNDGEFNPDDNA